MARNRFGFEKRRKELEKKNKKEAKRQARADRKAGGDVVGEAGLPAIVTDELGNAFELLPDPTRESAPDQKGSA